MGGNGGVDLTLLNNNLSNDSQALALQNFSDGVDADSAPFSGSGNTFTGSTNGIALSNMSPSSLVIGNSIAAGVNFVIYSTSGLDTVPGTAISLTRTTAVHAASYPLTGLFGIPPGHACALTLAPFIRYNATALDGPAAARL